MDTTMESLRGGGEEVKASAALADTIRIMSELKIDEGKAVMANKKPRVKPSGPETVKLTTNVYEIKTQKATKVYRYAMTVTQYVHARDDKERGIQLTKSVRGDASIHSVHDKCRLIFHRLCRDHEPLKGARCVYYDLQAIIYSLDKLNIAKKETLISVPIDEQMEELMPGSIRVDVTITPAATGFEVNLQDLSGISRDLECVERSLLQFFDIATSQRIMFPEEGENPEHVVFNSHRSYLMEPFKYGFEERPSWLYHDNSSYLAVGVQKGVHVIEGREGKKQLGLVVETKKTPFHRYESLLGKVNAILQRGQGRDVKCARDITVPEWNKLNELLKGIEVETSHSKRRYTVKQLASQTAAGRMLEIDGEAISVKDYFKRRHDIDLSFPDMPLVVMRDFIHSELPMELCIVCDSQRVKSDQQTSRCVQAMIKDCAVPPIELLQQNDNAFRSLRLQNNRYLDEASVNVSPQRIDLDARMLNPPKLAFAQNRTSEVRRHNYTWTNPGIYLVPGRCNKWAAFAFLGKRDPFHTNDFNRFLQSFVQTAQRRGVMINAPCLTRVLMSCERERVEEAFSHAKSDGCDFIVAVHGDLDSNTHGYVKFLEQRHELQTQCFRLSTVMKVVQKGQPATLENMVNKTNCKLGGINYSLEIQSPIGRAIIGSEVLIIGLAINHPGGKPVEESVSSASGARHANSKIDVEDQQVSRIQHPSIVGYSANIGKNPFEFVGDFIVQRSIGEVDIGPVVPEVVRQCVEQYKKHRGGRLPSSVIFYHNGASEGWFGNLLRYEVPLIRDVLRKAGCSSPKITLIVSNRLQSVRLFNKQIDPRARAPEQNVQPGCLVDSVVTHSEFAEFFLNSHRALQGTAKTPKYTVLIDENGFDIDRVAQITYQLCYGHQIVFLPTSLPTPVYVADEYAERGRKLYTQWIQENAETADYARVTDQLAYRGKETLKNHRLNA